jgi:hypothetical protein
MIDFSRLSVLYGVLNIWRREGTRRDILTLDCNAGEWWAFKLVQVFWRSLDRTVGDTLIVLDTVFRKQLQTPLLVLETMSNMKHFNHWKGFQCERISFIWPQVYQNVCACWILHLSAPPLFQLNTASELQGDGCWGGFRPPRGQFVPGPTSVSKLNPDNVYSIQSDEASGVWGEERRG